MKLTKSKLLKATQNDIEAIGYMAFTDNITSASGLFVKNIKNDYFLSLGFELSNFYHSKFSASFYLSKTTMWGSWWGDIPKESYQRIAKFLTKEERKAFLDDEHNREGVLDAWWNGNDSNEISKFIDVVKLTESRFLQQENLFIKVDNSKEIKILADDTSDVLNIIDTTNFSDNNSRYFSGRAAKAIPQKWFIAAEKILSRQKRLLNQHTVQRLAADAWRQNEIRNWKSQLS